VYAYNLEPLVQYLLSSVRFVDPLSAVPYNEIEVMRINNMKTKHLPELQPETDLCKLAFDEAYRLDYTLLQSLRNSTMERVRDTFTELMESFDPANIQRSMQRYVSMILMELRSALNSASLLNMTDAHDWVLSEIGAHTHERNETLTAFVERSRARPSQVWRVNVVINEEEEEEEEQEEEENEEEEEEEDQYEDDNEEETAWLECLAGGCLPNGWRVDW
jgi:hypothetical protein